MYKSRHYRMYPAWRKREGKKGTTLYCHLCSSERVEGKVKTHTLAYLGSVSEKAIKPERELFWMQVKANLDKLQLPQDKRVKIEAAVAQKVPRGRNPHGDSDAPCEWYTPPEYVEMAREVLGSIDLDPASNALAQGWIKATRYYTIEDDGLVQLWQGRVWCNPPYGRNVKLWLERALASYESGDVDAAVLLLNRTGAAWYLKLKKRVSAICEVEKRIAFLDAAGKRQSSPRYYNDFLYLGKELETFKRVFEPIGGVKL